ncbi:MAG: AAA domain-containing protein, partial [Ktedonobacteraceae bacterium]
MTEQDTRTKEELAGPSPAQERYLSQVEKVIKAIHDAEVAKGAQQQAIFYGQVDPIGKARYNRHDVYRFQRVSGGGDVEKGTFLCLEDDVRKRGSIVEVEEEYFILKFEQAVDIRAVRKAHSLIPTTKDPSFKVQRLAIEMLRDGTAKNRYLLGILAESRYQPYKRLALKRIEKLNVAQQEAFEQALSTPDIQLVLGPPGTGKTYTITEIVRACGQKHERVLVTAKTHKAVDNVLLSLPRGELEVLRVGNADKIDLNLKHLLIDERARTLQSSILQATEGYSQELQAVGEHLNELDRRAERLPDYNEALRNAERRVHLAITQRDQRRNEIENAFVQETTRRHAIWQAAVQDLTQHQTLIQTLQNRYAKANRRQNWILIGFFWRNQLPKLHIQISQAHYELAQKQGQQTTTRAAYDQLPMERAQVYQASTYRQLETHINEMSKALSNLEENIYAAASIFTNRLSKHFSPEQLHPLARSSSQLQSYLSWLQSTWTSTFRPTLLARDALMRDWRQELSARTEDLYPILLRMADVIGATCIGSGTAKILAEVEYDRVIVDEAGQISVADLLVPLVQGQRTLLVGDHQQLPPLADEDVRKRLQSLMKEERNEAEENEQAQSNTQ